MTTLPSTSSSERSIVMATEPSHEWSLQGYSTTLKLSSTTATPKKTCSKPRISSDLSHPQSRISLDWRCRKLMSGLGTLKATIRCRITTCLRWLATSLVSILKITKKLAWPTSWTHSVPRKCVISRVVLWLEACLSKFFRLCAQAGKLTEMMPSRRLIRWRWQWSISRLWFGRRLRSSNRLKKRWPKISM